MIIKGLLIGFLVTTITKAHKLATPEIIDAETV